MKNGALCSDRRFVGQTRDSIDAVTDANNDALYFFQSRYYDTRIGKFHTPDTLVPDPKNPQALNHYAYALNNPLKLVDPSGHMYDDPGDGGFTVIPPAPPVPATVPVPSFAPSAPSSPPTQSAPTAAPAPSTPATPVPTPAQNPPPPSSPSGMNLCTVLLNSVPVTPLSWLLPWEQANDLLGIAAGVAGGGQARKTARGILIFENVHGPVGNTISAWNGNKPAAITIGQVVLNTTTFNGDAVWLAHESAHVRQSENLGMAYLPIYYVLQVASGGVHDAHPMERQAIDFGLAYWHDYVSDASP